MNLQKVIANPLVEVYPSTLTHYKLASKMERFLYVEIFVINYNIPWSFAFSSIVVGGGVGWGGRGEGCG